MSKVDIIILFPAKTEEKSLGFCLDFITIKANRILLIDSNSCEFYLEEAVKKLTAEINKFFQVKKNLNFDYPEASGRGIHQNFSDLKDRKPDFLG